MAAPTGDTVLGAQFLPQDFDQYILSVQKAEEAGYEYAWLVDSQILWQEVYVYITRGLAATERIVFGTAVTNPLTRHWTVTASAWATLAELHPGRQILGIGRGDSAVRTMGLNPVKTSFLREAIPVIRDLMAGKHVTLNGADVYFRWVNENGAKVPIMMAATGPRNLRNAGALADVVQLYVGVNPTSVAWAIDHVRTGAVEAGRDPDEVKFSLLTGMWVSDDQEEAWARARWGPPACANHTEATMGRHRDHGRPSSMKRRPQYGHWYDS